MDDKYPCTDLPSLLERLRYVVNGGDICPESILFLMSETLKRLTNPDADIPLTREQMINLPVGGEKAERMPLYIIFDGSQYPTCASGWYLLHGISSSGSRLAGKPFAHVTAGTDMWNLDLAEYGRTWLASSTQALHADLFGAREQVAALQRDIQRLNAEKQACPLDNCWLWQTDSQDQVAANKLMSMVGGLDVLVPAYVLQELYTSAEEWKKKFRLQDSERRQLRMVCGALSCLLKGIDGRMVYDKVLPMARRTLDAYNQQYPENPVVALDGTGIGECKATPPEFEALTDGREPMEVREFNTQFFPAYNRASSFVHNIDNTLEKSGSEAQRQMRIAGWNEEMKAFLLRALTCLEQETRSQLNLHSK